MSKSAQEAVRQAARQNSGVRGQNVHTRRAARIARAQQASGLRAAVRDALRQTQSRATT
jgi:hypothetical protein